MSMQEVLSNLSEEERLLYLSAVDVKRSAFWKHLMGTLHDTGQYQNAVLLTKTMEGKEKEAVIAACMIQAIGLVIEKIDAIIEDVTVDALNQEQEEE